MVDFGLVARAYADDVRERVARSCSAATVERIERSRRPRPSRDAGGRGRRAARRSSARASTRTGSRSSPGRRSSRGSFRSAATTPPPARARHLAARSMYPVPDPTFPFLGVHTTVRLDGRCGSARTPCSPSPARGTAASRSGWATCSRPRGRPGSGDSRGGTGGWASPSSLRDFSRRLFVASARKLLPELAAGRRRAGPAGIRAQALSADGSLVDDFVIHEAEGSCTSATRRRPARPRP